MSEATGVCLFCGETTRRRGNTGPIPKYCSKSCTQRAGRRRRGEVPTEERYCAACGSSLAGFQANKVTCSRRCHAWATRNPGVPHPSTQPRVCLECGVCIDDRDVRSDHCSPVCHERGAMGYVVGKERNCARCGETFLTRRKSSTFCGPDCMRAADYEANKEDYIRRAQVARARRRDARVETFGQREVFERDGWICYLCGEPTDRTVAWPDLAMPSLDHVIPISKGGEHSRANTKCAHLGCNLRKGDRLLAEVASAMEAVV